MLLAVEMQCRCYAVKLVFTANSEQSRLHRNIEHVTEQTQS